MTAPDVAGQITGWRAWALDETGEAARLASVVHPGRWPVKEPFSAECHRLPDLHPAPIASCECGIYVARSVHEAAYHVELPSTRASVMPIGLATVWGKVVEGELGWRASRAYPEHLYLPLRDPRELDRIERVAWDLAAYGVPVEILDCTRRSIIGALSAATVGTDRPKPSDPLTALPANLAARWNRTPSIIEQLADVPRAA